MHGQLASDTSSLAIGSADGKLGSLVLAFAAQTTPAPAPAAGSDAADRQAQDGGRALKSSSGLDAADVMVQGLRANAAQTTALSAAQAPVDQRNRGQQGQLGRSCSRAAALQAATHGDAAWRRTGARTAHLGSLFDAVLRNVRLTVSAALGRSGAAEEQQLPDQATQASSSQAAPQGADCQRAVEQVGCSTPRPAACRRALWLTSQLESSRADRLGPPAYRSAGAHGRDPHAGAALPGPLLFT